MNAFSSETVCEFPAAFQADLADLAPTCPSCTQPMVHATGYFHCPQCRYAICEDWAQGITIAAGTGPVARILGKYHRRHP